ncbi:hypothetical protein, partial [Phocaeicola plebeius]
YTLISCRKVNGYAPEYVGRIDEEVETHWDSASFLWMYEWLFSMDKKIKIPITHGVTGIYYLD